MPATWSTDLPKGATTEVDSIAQWWTQFNDPILNSLIERAAVSNLDVQLALARVREAREALGIAEAPLFPAADAVGGYTHARKSEWTKKSAGPFETNLFQAGFDAGWEIDVFGKNRRAVERRLAAISDPLSRPGGTFWSPSSGRSGLTIFKCGQSRCNTIDQR